MKVITRNDTGKVMKVLKESDFFTWKNTINIPHTIRTIDEIEDNKNLCLDLLRTSGKVDVDGNPKYFYDGDVLMMEENWEEDYGDRN